MGADQPPTNPIALGASNPSALDLYRQKLNLHDTLVWIFRSLKKQAPAAKIVAVGYPRWFQSGGHGSDCEHFTEMDQTFINDRIALLDNIIQDAANESGVASYADVYNAFSGREECTGDPRHYLVDPSNGNLICYSDSHDINGVDLVQGVAKSPELLHPSPCGHITESQIVAPEFSAPNPNEIAQFSLLPGELRSTSITAPSSGDTRRMDISTTWTAAGVQTTLIGASGAVTPSVQGPTYAVWTILDPPPSSTWSLQISAPIATVNAGSSTIAINQTSSSVFLLGPASVVNGPTCANGSCTFTATVNTKVQPLVSTYDWYDEHANYLGSGSSISMAQEPSPQVGTLILKTSSIYGGDSYRYTTFDYALPCFGC